MLKEAQVSGRAAALLCVVNVLLAACGTSTQGDGGPPPECTFVEDPVERPAAAEPPAAVDYLVSAADPLVSAAEEHAEYRDQTGRRSEVLRLSAVLEGATDGPTAIERIRAAIATRRDALAGDRPLFVLLLGDASAGWHGDAAEVPAAEVGGWGWAEEITSDNAVADLDGDDLPDVALGRVPVRTAEQAEQVLGRTRDLEQGYEPGPWATRVNVFASEAGFGAVIDSVIEEAGFAAVEEVPYDVTISFTYARPGSPYAYPPALFSDRVYELMNQGSMLVTYIGHGWEEGFASIEWEGEVAPIFDTADLGLLDMQHRVPLLLFIACLTGSFDTGDSLTERFLLQPRGAVAVISSTEVSHPYANGVMTREISVTLLQQRLRTVGEVFMEAKRRMVTAASDMLREDLDNLSAVDETTRTAELRQDLLVSHEHMFNLFGDPAHVVAYPAGSVEVSLEAEEVVAGEPVRACLQVHGPASGHAVVTLETDRDIIAYNLERWQMGDPGRDDVIVANNALANDKVVEVWQGDYEGGGIAVTLPTSTEHTGTLHLRAYVSEGSLDAVGTAEVSVQPPAEDAP